MGRKPVLPLPRVRYIALRLLIPIELIRSRYVSELQCWGQTHAALQEVARIEAAAPPAEALHKVNKWMATVHHDEVGGGGHPEGLEALKSLKGKLTSGLGDIKSNAEAEAK